MKDCPCGSVFPYTDCCGVLIRGATVADTPEDLMRSRYTAYVMKEWDYIRSTTHPEERENIKDLDSANEGVHWKKLEIFNSSKESADDLVGEVVFAAYYEKDGEEQVLEETSKFVKEKGRWYYYGKQSKPKIVSSSPTPPKKPFVRKESKVGRNDPCPCGSEKKYKKCCGK